MLILPAAPMASQTAMITEIAAADSDSNSESGGEDAYYRPISAYSGSDSDSDESPSPLPCNGVNPNPNPLHLDAVENGINDVDLNGFVGDHDEEGMEEREREASISRALMEDESWRRAPLSPESATRVMDAMRGVIFQGIPPAWADTVPEDRWADQLRRLRGEPTTPSS